MPRLARLDAPGVLHHVMARGIERRKIFLGDEDRDDFVRRVASLSASGALMVYAWALLPNHFHLVVRTGRSPLSRSMRSLMSGYAGQFNRRHRPQWASFSEPIQEYCVRGGDVSSGTYKVRPSQPVEGKGGEGSP